MSNRLWILLCLLLTHYTATAQDTAFFADAKIVSSYVKDVNAKVDRLGRALSNYTDRSLKKLQKYEAGIKRKLARTDSLKATEVFSDLEQRYRNLQHRLQNTTTIRQYIPSLDTMTSALKFLQQSPQIVSITKNSESIKGLQDKVGNLGSKLEKAEELKKFLKERKQDLKDRMQDIGFAKELKRLNKQAYYYSEQLNEYKSLLKDQKKAERKLIELLSKTKAFQNFMRKNSILASLFRLPVDPNDPTNMSTLAGLQTRAQVTNLIQQQVSAGGPSAQQQLQQNLQAAQMQITSLKNKVSQFGKSSSGDIMPDGFKPNNQKAKGFWRRLEFGSNIQSQKARGYFPVTSDIGLTLGYKPNDKSVVGIGSSYRLGLGENIRHIKISHQGIGIRSFVDWKIKGSWWVSGGYEMNYRSIIDNFDELRHLSAWSHSGLLGLSKIISVKTKFFKKTKLQVLWDMLSYQQVPRTQPLLFRIGYTLK